MRDDPLLRRMKRAARLPLDARCGVCGRSNEEVRLVPPRQPEDQILCLDHRRQRRGVSGLDIGHVARARSWSSLTVLMPASANQRIEDMRRDLGLADTPDPLGDPLLVEADYLEGSALIHLLQAEFNRRLAAHLRERFGERYWEGGPLPPVL